MIYVFNAIPIVSGTIQASMIREIDKLILNGKGAERLKQF